MLDNDGFNEEQKQYLSGFVAGCDTVRAGRGLPTFAQVMAGGAAAGLPVLGGTSGAACATSKPEVLVLGPEKIHRDAQDRFLAAGKKLVAEEDAKRNKHPFEMWDEMRANAAASKFPKGTDVFLYKYHGLFYVAPAQNAFMCRLRIWGGMLPSYQLRGLADLADQCAAGYTDVTTRANLQFREIPPQSAIELLEGLQEIGVVSRGSGADNLRNITCTPSAGIDPCELIDTRPLARELHHYVLNHRELYGLPRKFNIAFDGGGLISALAETNDIGFAAVRVGEGHELPAGVYFRLELGGITGHKDFARDTGVMLKAEECLPVAAAMLRVFIDHGDRTDRKKARLKYVLDAWGFDKFLVETEKLLPFALRRFPIEKCEPRGPIERLGHLGVHAQKQDGKSWLGVLLPVGRMTSEQMRGLARIADRYGSGHVRLTVWQNLLIPDIIDEDLPLVQREVEALGLDWKATQVRAGLVACTGAAGCKYAASHTKQHALAIAEYMDSRLDLDQPINIHITGCHHSCAQHYIGDIGLLGAKVAIGDDMVEGYHVYVGGGYGEERLIGRELARDVPFEEAPPLIERLLRGYLEHRLEADESFYNFVCRHSTEQLQQLAGVAAAAVG